MAKLTAIQKADRRDLLEAIHDAGGAVFTFPMLGVTVAIRPAVSGKPDSQFVHVSIAQCDMDMDVFKRKVGELMALDRMYAYDNYISISRNGRTNEHIAADMKDFLNQ